MGRDNDREAFDDEGAVGGAVALSRGVDVRSSDCWEPGGPVGDSSLLVGVIIDPPRQWLSNSLAGDPADRRRFGECGRSIGYPCGWASEGLRPDRSRGDQKAS